MRKEQIAASLEARRAELLAELARITERPTEQVPSVSFGKRVGDGTAEAVERIHLTSAARSLAAMLGDVDRARNKLAEGTYGVCDGCGGTIPEERLDAIPWTALCVACSRKRSG